MYKWDKAKKEKINELDKKLSKHKFKPEINAVSKMIAEQSSLNTSQSSLNSNLLTKSVHEKLYLSRNNSHGLLPSNPKTCVNKVKHKFDSRSNSVSDFKTY
jgi:hypothetical protein